MNNPWVFNFQSYHHEIAALLQYLDNQKSQSEGVGNFKEPVWNNALEAIKDYHS